MAQTNYTPIQLYYSTTAAAVPVNTNLLNGELAINITDGKLYYKDNSGTVQVIATKGAGTIGGSTTQIQYNNAGALAGSSDMTYTSATNTVLLTKLNLTNALGATYGGTGLASYTVGDLLYADTTTSLAKLALGTANYILTVNSGGTGVQWSAPSAISVSTATNLAGGVAGSVPYQSGASTTTFLGIGAADRVMTSSGSAPQWVTALTGLTGVSSSSITNTSLTSGRVVYSSTGGLQANSANLTFDGTTLTTTGLSNSGTSALVKLVTVGNTSFNGTTVFAAATPAKLYMGTGTVTDATSAIGATNAVGAVASLAITPIAATNTSVTYTDAATLYIAGAPSAGTNITLTNPYALYIAAGNVYLGGGTANGVAYLNGSKVLTTGSALVFDGTNLGLGVTPSAWATFKAFQNGGSSFADFGGANNAYFGSNVYYDGTVYRYIATAGASSYRQVSRRHEWYNALSGTAGDPITFTQAMTLDASGNLGIGTSSPAGKLHVVGAQNAWSQVIAGNTTSAQSYGMRIQAGTTSADTSLLIRDATNTADYLAVIGNGNVGIGTSSPTAKLEVASDGSTLNALYLKDTRAYTTTPQSNIGFIFQSDSGGTYTTGALIRGGKANANNNDYASELSFWTRVNGGNLTQRAVIDSSGNLLVGTTSANQNIRIGQKLGVVSTGSGTYGGVGISSYSGTSAAVAPVIDINRSRGTTDQSFTAVASGDILGYIVFRGSDGTGFTDAAYIQGAVDGTVAANQVPSRLMFSTANSAGTVTERARFTSGGYFKASNSGAYASVGATFHEIINTADNAEILFLRSTATSNPYGITMSWNSASPNDTTRYFLRCDDSTAQRFTARSNGGLANYSANDVNLSDRREKTNFAPAKSYLDVICAIPVQTFNYIDQNMEDDGGLTLGVVAQDVQAVAPELVMESDWGTEDEPKMRLSIYQTDLQYALMKALQELKAEFDAYKASHP